MTQDYLNQLFENYTGVEKFYWTADGSAFKNIDDAMKYAERLPDSTVKAVSHGGQLEDAKVIVEGLEQDLDQEDVNVNPAAVNAGNEAGAADVEITNMKIKDLRALCKIRKVDFDKDATKEQLIELLQAKAKEDAEKQATVDYTTMDVEALQALCTEREIEMSGNEDAEQLIQLLTEWDAAQAPQE